MCGLRYDDGMSLSAALLELLAAHGVRSSRSVRIALQELLEAVADANPDREDELFAEDDSEDNEAGLAVRTISCPHCGEPVIIRLELDGGTQSAIQDCSVCCRPIAISWDTRDGALDHFDTGPV